MADTIKCPNCSANLKFEPGAAKLACEYCGGVFNIDEIKTKIEALESKEADAESVEFICNACGGKILADMNTSASFCPFCGSPALVSQRLTGEFTPKYIIPFRYNREKAESAFLKWCKGGKYAPVNFVSKKNIEKLTGLYVPFWLYDMKGDVSLNGTGHTTTYSGNYTIHKDYEFEINGTLSFEKMPFDGETRIDDALMEAIEPYDYKKMIPFDYKYLPGFFADRYDQSKEDIEQRALRRGSEYINNDIEAKLKKYDRHQVKKNDTKIGDIKAEYALLPVWFLHYKYLGKDFYFAMNGQTGEVAGKAPVSRVKQLVFYSVMLAVISVVFRFIAGLIMGGFVG